MNLVNKWKWLCYIGILIGLSFQSFVVTEAIEGGEVDISVGITFEEAVESTDSSSSPSSDVTADTSIGAAHEKPKGKLPSTGEKTKTYLFLGIGFLLLFLWVIGMKRRKEQ